MSFCAGIAFMGAICKAHPPVQDIGPAVFLGVASLIFIALAIQLGRSA